MPVKKQDEPVVTNKQEESLADSKKIDLYINNDNDGEQGISLMNVFSTLGKRFRIFVWVIIIGLLAGLLVPTLIYTFKDKKDSAVAILGLDYANAEQGLAPDGSELDISYIKILTELNTIKSVLNNIRRLNVRNIKLTTIWG